MTWSLVVMALLVLAAVWVCWLFATQAHAAVERARRTADSALSRLLEVDQAVHEIRVLKQRIDHHANHCSSCGIERALESLREWERPQTDQTGAAL